MSSLRRVVKNTSALLVSSLLGKGASFLSVLLAARYLGADGYGLLAFAISFNYLFDVIVSFGFGPLIVKDLARNRALAILYVKRILIIKGVLVVLAFTIIALTIRLLGFTGYKSIVFYMLFAFIVFQSFANVGFSVLKAFELMQYVAFGEFATSFLVLTGFSLAIIAGADIIAFSLAYALAGGCMMFYSIIILTRILRREPIGYILERPDISTFSLIRESLPFAITSGLNLILLYMDSVMLGVLRTQSEVGIYGAAYRSALVLLFISMAMSISLVPMISKLHGIGSEKVAGTIRKYFHFSFVFGIPLGVGGSIIASSFIPALFGTQYSEASLIFAILIWSIVFAFLRTPFITMFEATDRQAVISRIFAFAVAINVGLNLAFIPRFGMTGAAVSTVVTDAFILVIMLRLASKLDACRFDREQLVRFIKVFISSVCMGAACIFALRFGLFYSVAVGVIVYVSFLFVWNVFSEDEVALLRRAIKL